MGLSPSTGLTPRDTIGPSQAPERISDRLLGLDPAFRTDLPFFYDFLEVENREVLEDFTVVTDWDVHQR